MANFDEHGHGVSDVDVARHWLEKGHAPLKYVHPTVDVQRGGLLPRCSRQARRSHLRVKKVTQGDKQGRNGIR